MQRYLRRHVARDSGHWVRQFMASYDPVEIAQLMRSSRAALLVFGEMLWARTLEPGVSRRRWPYREDATQDGRPIWGHLVLRGVQAETRSLQLNSAEWQWLQYQASGAVIAAAWRRSMALAVQSARKGIANWLSTSTKTRHLRAGVRDKARRACTSSTSCRTGSSTGRSQDRTRPVGVLSSKSERTNDGRPC